MLFREGRELVYLPPPGLRRLPLGGPLTDAARRNERARPGRRRRAESECPSNVWRPRPSARGHTLSVLSLVPEIARSAERAATHWTCDAATQRVVP